MWHCKSNSIGESCEAGSVIECKWNILQGREIDNTIKKTVVVVVGDALWERTLLYACRKVGDWVSHGGSREGSFNIVGDA